MDEERIIVSEGKYTFIKDSKDWRIRCLRYGISWMVFVKGHKAISGLMFQYKQLQTDNERLKKAIIRGRELYKNNEPQQMLLVWDQALSPPNDS